MRTHSKSDWLVVLFGTVLLLLLLSAAALMYRWINRSNEADRQQEKEFLETAMRSFQGEFSSAVKEILFTFHPATRLPPNTTPESFIAELYWRWQSTSHWPQIVGAVGIGTATPDGVFTFRRFHPQGGQFEERKWPASLDVFGDLLKQRLPGGVPPSVPTPGLTSVLSANPPVIVLPLAVIIPARAMPTAGSILGRSQLEFPRHVPGPVSRADRIPDPGSSPFSAQRPLAGSSRVDPPTQLIGWCVLELDWEFIQKQFLPALVERHFGGAGLSNYRLAVVTGHPRRVLYRSDPALTPEALASVDATATLLNPWVASGLHTGHGPIMKRNAKGKGSSAGGKGVFDSTPNPEDEDVNASSTWQLVAKHKSGSLDAVMNAARYRNLGIGFGLLLLLASGMVLLVLTTYRARALDKQQMEFVAGVSHELRTPLAVIRSAGFNLAKGLIGDPGRVQQYGAVIQREGHRLSDMVEQILMYAGIQSGRKHYDLKPTAIPDVIDRALADYAAAFEEAAWRVEKKVEEGLPPVLADAQALESAIKNLLQNVLKYASDGKWLGISARVARGKKGPEVQVTIEDHGPGIDPADLPHILNPFYRGHEVLASPIPGVGLGLSLVRRHVEAHGGRVTVRTSRGDGSAFALHLPALSHTESGSSR